jgi:hypothetical protein
MGLFPSARALSNLFAASINSFGNLSGTSFIIVVLLWVLYSLLHFKQKGTSIPVMIEGNRHLCAHTEIEIKGLLGRKLRTYIADGEPIPPESVTVKFYNEGDAVPNGSAQGIHDHSGHTFFGAPKLTPNGTVGDAIPVRDVTAVKNEASQ